MGDGVGNTGAGKIMRVFLDYKVNPAPFSTVLCPANSFLHLSGTSTHHLNGGGSKCSLVFSFHASWPGNTQDSSNHRDHVFFSPLQHSLM